MVNIGRKIGVNIFTLMQNAGYCLEELADDLTKRELLHYKMNKFIPELQYMKEFSDIDNLDKILDLLDEYIELKETM